VSNNSLGKRRQYVDEVVASKHSALHNANSTPVTGDESSAFTPATSAGMFQPVTVKLESTTFDEMPYNHDIPLLESLRPELMEPPKTEQVADTLTSLPVPAAVIASLPSVGHMFQLSQPYSAPTSTGFPSQHAAEASVHPLLSMVQQVIPPLHDYSPPMPLSHAVYPSHGSPPPAHQALQPSHHALQPSHHALRPSHHALQPSHHAVDQPASSGLHQSNAPLVLTRTASSTTRGSSSHAKSTPPTPKVIIVSGTGMSSATTIAGPPPPMVTTSAVSKAAPGQSIVF